MSTIMISELAKLMPNMSKEETERFANEFFQVLLYGLEKEKTVKIKGLGSFKITKAKGCESADSNSSSTKFLLSFIPDASMREAANKAFSQFEPVMLNEGVVFDDITEEECVDFAEAENMDENEQNDTYLTFVEHITPETQGTDAIETQKSELNESVNETQQFIENQAIETQTEPSFEANEEELNQNTDTEESNEDDIKKSSNLTKKLWYILGAACLVGIIGFFSMNMRHNNSDTSTALTTISSDTVHQTPKEMVNEQPTENYDALNAQIPYGAYKIVGIDTVITVTKGLDLDAIARIFLGTEMQVYLVVMNNGNDNPTEGQTYKIPKLELKR